jgi:hypothetical protein
MNKFLIVGLVVCGAFGVAQKSQALPSATESYRVEFSGTPGVMMNGSIVWTDAANLQRSTHMETAQGNLPLTIPLELPTGSTISASGSSHLNGQVSVKIFRNGIELAP